MAPTAARPAPHAGRDAFERRAWGDAYAELAAADRTGDLAGADLELLAQAAYLTGRDEEYLAGLERAHRAYVEQGEPTAAARVAMWIGMTVFARGETVRGGGWLARAGRLLEDVPDAVEQGYLLIAAGRFALERGDVDDGRRSFERAATLAERWHDPDLAVMCRLGLGQAAVLAGEVADGLAILDEAMVSLRADGVGPITTGIVYCAVIGLCHALHDVRRASEWVNALGDWCESQPDLVPFRGQCMVHRSEILQLRGAWHEAFEVAHHACERLAGPPSDPALAAAHYQRAELHRLRGEAAASEAAYRRASELGASPQPGLALLRAQQGRLDAADAALRRALDEEDEPMCRARLLGARTEVLLGLGHGEAARACADELGGMAARLDIPLLHALHAFATSAVLVTEGDAAEALVWLRRSQVAWRDLDAPYECARTRVLTARVSAQLGDLDGASLDREAARRAFEELGARPDLERLDRETAEVTESTPGGLTDRELEVLRLVAAGRTNRDIARELVISEHTVARHVQNILSKLRVTSRTAAAAFAFEHALL